MSLWLDVRLMLGTVLKCLGVPFAWIGRILQLPDPNVEPAVRISRFGTELTASSLVTDPYIKLIHAVTVLAMMRSEFIGQASP